MLPLPPLSGGFTSAVVAIYRGNHIAALILIGRNLRAIGNINYIFVVRIALRRHSP